MLCVIDEPSELLVELTPINLVELPARLDFVGSGEEIKYEVVVDLDERVFSVVALLDGACVKGNRVVTEDFTVVEELRTVISFRDVASALVTGVFVWERVCVVSGIVVVVGIRLFVNCVLGVVESVDTGVVTSIDVCFVDSFAVLPKMKNYVRFDHNSNSSAGTVVNSFCGHCRSRSAFTERAV